MNNEASAVVTLVMGVVIGVPVGFTAAWRLARKLEHHCVSLRAWDTDIYEAEQRIAVNRLREKQS